MKRPNGYVTRCARCTAPIAVGVLIDLARVAGRWTVTHLGDLCPGQTPTAAQGATAAEMDEELAAEAAALTLPDVTGADIDIEGVPTEKLFVHQAQVVAAVLQGRRRLLLADEPGLGKTATSLVSLAAARTARAVIVVPAVVKLNWGREAATWLPGWDAQVASGRTPTPIAPTTRLLVINPDILSQWLPAIRAWGPDGLIIDEAHMIKSRDAARGQAALTLAERLPRGSLRMLLTGTPVPNRPIDLAHPLDVLGLLDDFGGYWMYARRYAGAFESKWGWDVSGATNLPELHTRLARSCMVRRRKADAVDLPTKTVVDVPVELAGAAARSVHGAQDALVHRLTDVLRETYGDIRPTNVQVDRVVSQALAGGGVAFSEMAALRSELGLAKAALTIDQTRDLLEAGEPVVVMVHHRAVQDAIAEALTDWGVVRITGGQSMDARQAAIDAFQRGDARVAVCSIQAAGVGITLHAASQVVLGELPWTSAAQDQAIDRCHRIGQDAPVTAWRIIAAGTLDERLAAVISDKAATALAVVDGGEVAVGTSELSAAQALTDLVLLDLGRPARKRRPRKVTLEAVAA